MLTFVFMKNILTVILMLLCLPIFAQETQPKPEVKPEMKRFVYQANTTITKRVYDSIYFDISYDAGDKWVFKYTYMAPDVVMIADDEYYETYEFEMTPPKGKSFVITGDDIEKHKLIFNRGCFCPDGGIRQLYEGTITGKKVRKNTWLLTFDIMLEPRPGREGNAIPKKFKGYFKPGKLVF